MIPMIRNKSGNEQPKMEMKTRRRRGGVYYMSFESEGISEYRKIHFLLGAVIQRLTDSGYLDSTVIFRYSDNLVNKDYLNELLFTLQGIVENNNLLNEYSAWLDKIRMYLKKGLSNDQPYKNEEAIFILNLGESMSYDLGKQNRLLV
jgi:arylsulfatase A-like enzyme